MSTTTLHTFLEACTHAAPALVGPGGFGGGGESAGGGGNMTMLFVYLAIGLGASFLCSMLEAVLLSVPRAHVMIMAESGSKAGTLLERMKADIDRPLAAILTLNTFAHTIGAAGVGAEATAIWGSKWVGLVGFIVTLLILIFSEIIPKTIGAVHAKRLAGFATMTTQGLIVLLWPFVWSCNRLSKVLTKGGGGGHGVLSRDEVRSVATIAQSEGALSSEEADLIHNLIGLHDKRVREVMTPRTVVATLGGSDTVGAIVENSMPGFARLPVIENSLDDARAYVHRHDVLSAISNGDLDKTIAELARPLNAIPETTDLRRALSEFLRKRTQIFLVVDEHGGGEGILTLEDCIETLLGREIVDETDGHVDMQAVAKRLRAARNTIDPGAAGAD